MKKLLIILAISASMILSGCSLLGEVNNAVNYVNETTDHINNLSNFAEEAPQLIEEAATNTDVQKELESKLIALKADIEDFIQMNDIPAVAEEVHQELVKKNEVLLAEINKVLESGHLALDQLEKSEIITTINDVNELLNRIEQLGQ